MSDLGNLTTNEDGSRSTSEGVVVGRPYMDQNPDDLKNNATLAEHATVGDLSKSYLELHGKVAGLDGNHVFPKLGENPTDEEKTAYSTSLRELRGVPESSDVYELGKPEGLPENYPWDEGLNDVFRKSVHSRGINPEEAKGVFDDVNKYNIEQYNDSLKAIADNKLAAEAELKKAWPGDAHAANTEKAKRAFSKFGGEDGLKFMEESGLGNNPVMVKMFHSIFEAIGEDSFASPGGQQNNDSRPTGPDGKPVFKFKGMDK